MKIKDYLKQVKTMDVTFVIAKAVKDENTPFYHYEYHQTPIRNKSEWMEWSSSEEYIVLNKDHNPIDITGYWNKDYNRGTLSCCIISKISDFYLMYSEKQANEMIEYYENSLL